MSWLWESMDSFAKRWSAALQSAPQTENEHSQCRATVGQGGKGNRLECSWRVRRSACYLTWKRGDARCAQAVRDPFYVYGRDCRRAFPLMRGWSKGEKDWLFPRVLTSIAMTFAVVPRIHPRVNITNYFSAFWKEGTAQAEQVYTQKNVDLVEDLGRAAGFTSRRPPSPLSLGLGLARWSRSQTARRSVPTIYQRMAARPVWTGDASKGYESGSKT